VLAVLAPLALAVLWGIFASPRARVHLGTRPKVALRLALLLGSALALAAAGQPMLAVVLTLVILADAAVLAALGRPVS
jgi:Protein of unknown function (DUF2568)